MQEDGHYKMTAVVDALPASIRGIVRGCAVLATVAFMLILAKVGVECCMKIAAMGQKSPTLKIPMWIAYASIPAGMILGVVQAVLRESIRLVSGKDEKGRGKMIMAVLFAVLFGAIFFGIPICFSLAMSSWAALSIFEPNTNMVVLAQRIFTQADNYVFMAVPFFMLAGELMLKGGISKGWCSSSKQRFGGCLPIWPVSQRWHPCFRCNFRIESGDCFCYRRDDVPGTEKGRLSRRCGRSDCGCLGNTWRNHSALHSDGGFRNAASVSVTDLFIGVWFPESCWL